MAMRSVMRQATWQNAICQAIWLLVLVLPLVLPVVLPHTILHAILAVDWATLARAFAGLSPWVAAAELLWASCQKRARTCAAANPSHTGLSV